MTNTELQIKGLLTELQARTDQMSVTVAKVEGLERELAAAQKNSDLAQAETYGQFDRARRAEADRDRLREALILCCAEVEHEVPHGCWATGPMTGDIVQDLIVCPGCTAVEAANAALNDSGEHPDTAMLEKRVAELEAALEQIGNVLGPGTCAACQCEGCAWEAKEAVRLAISALAHTATHSHSPVPEVGKMVEHPDTVKHCCGAAGFGREWPGEQRDVCPACAKRAEQWEREALEKALVRVIEEAERG